MIIYYYSILILFVNKMLNQPILEAWKPCSLGNIYVREINGTTHEAYFSQDKTLHQILKQIYGNQLPEDIKLIYKSRLLYLDQTVSQNKITQNQTINILKNSSKNQQNYHQTASINFKGQLYRIQFQQDDKVIDLKKKSKNKLMFLDNFLGDEDYMKQYQVNDGDVIYLGEIQDSRKDNVVDFKKKIIHHKLDKNRRGSDGGIILQNQFLRSDKKQPNKFVSSQINAISRSTIDLSQSPSKKLQIELLENRLLKSLNLMISIFEPALSWFATSSKILGINTKIQPMNKEQNLQILFKARSATLRKHQQSWALILLQLKTSSKTTDKTKQGSTRDYQKGLREYEKANSLYSKEISDYNSKIKIKMQTKSLQKAQAIQKGCLIQALRCASTILYSYPEF